MKESFTMAGIALGEIDLITEGVSGKNSAPPVPSPRAPPCGQSSPPVFETSTETGTLGGREVGMLAMTMEGEIKIGGSGEGIPPKETTAFVELMKPLPLT